MSFYNKYVVLNKLTFLLVMKKYNYFYCNNLKNNKMYSTFIYHNF